LCINTHVNGQWMVHYWIPYFNRYANDYNHLLSSFVLCLTKFLYTCIQ
jgi:hypothetical protein